MACPNQGIIDQSITFTIRTLDSNDDPAWADSAPLYTVYDGTILAANVVGTLENLTMTMDSTHIGLYSASITLSSTLFELYQPYVIVVDSTVGGVNSSRTYTFTVVSTHDADDLDLDDNSNINTVAEFKGTFKQGNTANLNVKIWYLDKLPKNERKDMTKKLTDKYRSYFE